MWWEGNPCNMHLLDLAGEIAAGVRDAGMVPMRFNTIGVSDGISMGTDGMSYSLPSRDLIADSIETVMSAQWYDGVVTVPGCDKNMPGSLMAMARLNRPGLMVYGGTIAPGQLDGEALDIVSAFEAYGAVSSVNVIVDRETGRSKGFAFVELDNNSEADAAIKGLNGQAMGGRAINVNEAKPRAGGSRPKRW